MREEVAKVLGVPFAIIPFKANPGGTPPAPVKRHHVHALPQRESLEITFPRVDGYTQAIRNRVAVNWDNIAPLALDPAGIPPEIQMKAMLPTNIGRPSLLGPGGLVDVSLNSYRAGRRVQELAFDLAAAIVRQYCGQPSCEAPPHVLFPQVARIVERYLRERVQPVAPAQLIDVFCSPYYGWVQERLLEEIHPDAAQGEAPEVPRYETSRGPGSTADVSFWTSKEVREVLHSHLNYIVADTDSWEQRAATALDTHPLVEAFVKNEQLGFTIAYLHNGQAHEYIPDFLVRVRRNGAKLINLILEMKGYDPLKEVKKQAAERWVAAVNAEGSYGRWCYRMARAAGEVAGIVLGVSG